MGAARRTSGRLSGPAGLFEFDDVEGRVRNKILEMEAAWRRTLIELVRRAVELGHLRRDVDVDQFVWELCGIYLGHHAAHRFLRAADADSRAQTAFAALVDRAMPPGSRREAAPRARRVDRKTSIGRKDEKYRGAGAMPHSPRPRFPT